MVVYFKKFADRTRESLDSITTLLKRSLEGVFADLCATYASTDRAQEVEADVNKMRHELDRLQLSTAKKAS